MVRHVVDTRQLKDRRFLGGLFELTDEMKRKVRSEEPITRHKGRRVRGLFYQSSTRTRELFEAAAQNLGASTIFTTNAGAFSSAAKGEKLEHTLLAVEDCYHAVVIRHPENGSAKRAASVSRIPVINAGDGTNQHPTQALLDVYTINEHHGLLDGLKIVFVGDIKRGRTIKSLAYLLAHREGNVLCFVAPREMRLPDEMRAYLRERNIDFHETDNLDPVLSEADILYVTRFQWEYVPWYKRWWLRRAYKEFQITYDRAERMKEGSIIMHPLPINTDKSGGYPEIAPEVDSHPRAHYIKQSNNGLYVRMALLDVMLTGDSHPLYNLIQDIP